MLKYLSLLALIVLLLFARVTPAAALSQKKIPAKAAIVMDDSGTVLFAKFPNAKLAPASTVKLVTAMVAIDKLKLADRVQISRNAASVRSIQPRLRPDEEMTVSDLLHLALMKSINSAAVALAEAAAGSEQDFVILMNRKVKELGANSTLFANASGLPKGAQYTTAGDLALILKHALSYPVIREILGTKACVIRTAGGREFLLENSDELLWRNENIIGGKTGYTGNARHCFVCAINTENGPVFTAVLGARSRSSLWKSTLMLAEIGMNREPVSFMEKPRATRWNAPLTEDGAERPEEKGSWKTGVSYRSAYTFRQQSLFEPPLKAHGSARRK